MEKAKPKGDAYKELMEMIGLTEAKNVILQALNYHKAQKLFADKGMKVDHPAMHMVFTGNPGTAKTTVARLFARIMRENGLLSRGHLAEVGRDGILRFRSAFATMTAKARYTAASPFQSNNAHIFSEHSSGDNSSVFSVKSYPFCG